MDTWMLEKLAEGKIGEMRREADAWRRSHSQDNQDGKLGRKLRRWLQF